MSNNAIFNKRTCRFITGFHHPDRPGNSLIKVVDWDEEKEKRACIISDEIQGVWDMEELIKILDEQGGES